MPDETILLKTESYITALKKLKFFNEEELRGVENECA
jgi:hypothetical protein